MKQSPYFLANEGHDHTLIISVNQHMNYFFNAKACTELLMLCWNCTKISIDDYIFVAKNREFELKTRGINWHAVPFPSDYHYDSRVFGHSSHSKLPSWETKAENRSHLVSYLGNPRKFSALSSSIREALVIQCMNNSDVCTHGNYNHEAHESPNYDSRRCTWEIFFVFPTTISVFFMLQMYCSGVLFAASRRHAAQEVSVRCASLWMHPSVLPPADGQVHVRMALVPAGVERCRGALRLR